jgi:siroheme synthase (precorrin-2 oxidase/ferrochelatase)
MYGIDPCVNDDRVGALVNVIDESELVHDVCVPSVVSILPLLLV